MHREISHADSTFAPESPLPLYLFTGLLAVLLGLDLGPTFMAWLGWPGALPWASDGLGYRFALIAAVLGGARVLYGSLQGLLEGKLGADLALAIACLAAILMNEPLVAAEVVFIGMVGECLEAFTFARTQKAIRRIVEVFPLRCWLIKDGQEVRVFTTELKVGDRVVVKPGAKVPVDGVILDGRSAVDVSPLTGESVPLDKGPGDEVLAGSMNQFGALTIEAHKVADKTVAGKVIELTARALKDKTSGERLADRMARYFLPLVLGLALLTFLIAFAYHGKLRTPPLGLRAALTASMYPTLAVLVVTCPCALILATPAAIMAALARLAGTGVYIKGGSALERLAQVTALALDKTGTLTEGRLEVRGVHPLPGIEADELLRWAASAEQSSEHPLARAVVDDAKRRGLALDAVINFQAFPGAGIVSGLSQGTILVGTKRLLHEQGIAWPDVATPVADAIDAAGQTALWVAKDGRVLGAIGAQDHPRPEAAGVLAEFRALGLAPIMLLTGDRRPAAQSLATELGLTDLHAELLPHQKADLIDSIKKTGAKVAMLGDGINDAPALARADVGLAISGIDLAAEAGDIVLLGDPLRPLPLLFRLSRQTVTIIRQNILWFAFGVNFVGIVVTAWLWPLIAPAGWSEQSPLAAVIYHQLGSLAVLLNSMRLLWFERTSQSPAWVRMKGSLRDVDLWIDHTFDWHEWTHWFGTHLQSVLSSLAIVGVVGYVLTGLTIVKPDEKAVIRRFGRPVATLEPGWFLRWPWPIEDATRVSDRLRTVEVGFREVSEKLRQPASWTWTSAHRKDNRRQEEAMMLTGDGNLVDIQAVLRFKVIDPQVYLFEVAGVDDILRASTETVLRGLVAGRPFQELLTVQRAEFQDQVLARLKATLAAYNPRGLGVELEGIALIDLHPPGEVVEAYYNVAKAMEGRDRRVNEAQERAIAQRKAADAEAKKIVAQARAMSLETVLKAAGETTRFLDRSQARRGLSEQQELRWILDGIEMVLRGMPSDEAEKQLAERRRRLIADQIAISDFRSFWDIVGKALTGRDLVLIDSDNIRGQRNLFLLDPDLLRPSLPMFVPPDRRPAGPKGPDGP